MSNPNIPPMDYTKLDVDPVNAISVYRNEANYIVIQQARADDGYMEEDQVIVFPVEHAEAILNAIKREQELVYEDRNNP